jgi:TolB protein
MGADGSNQVRITNNDTSDKSPAWSPDSSHIVFASNWHIAVMRADGTGKHTLTTEGRNTDPEWSPDGRHIAYSSDASGSEQIYTMNIDGTNKVQLTTQGLNTAPSWSADGSHIIFTSNRSGTWGTYVMNVDGTGQTMLTGDGGNDVYPNWSAFTESFSIAGHVVDETGAPITDVTVYDAAGRNVGVTTNSSGQYTLSDLPAGSYTVAPLKEGYVFDPPWIEVEVPFSAFDKDFTASPATNEHRSYLPLIISGN